MQSHPWVLVGCGYTGTRLARALVGQGADVTVTRRDRAALETLAGQLGVRGVRVDLAMPSTLLGVIPPDAIVVVLAPPGDDPAREIGGVIDASRDAHRLVYVSSTGVYAPGGGAVVDEAWPLAPVTESGQRRLAAESALADAEVPAVVLRVAGIHGPSRGLVDRIRDGTYRIVGDGTAHVSRIHVDDLVAAIIAAGQSDVTGAINIADDDPAPIGEVADTIARTLGVAAPPRVAPDSVSPEVAGMLLADRRIANARMKRELGVTLRYPSWRALISGGGAAG
ncbi:MAG TPA: NAD-dependent epimerase/dehydratase family protein [Kofleriaceae bacterium]|nr:NAD-dependent epimerase/dehydratase family protein [Kofleriaceae bacterium]